MRSFTTAATLAQSGSVRDRASYVQVEVYDGTSWIDLSDHVDRDWLLGVTISDDQEGRAAAATIKVRTRHDMISMSPGMPSSLANTPNIVLALGNSVRINAALMPSGAPPAAADWFQIFTGSIERVTLGAAEITVACKDSSATIASAFIETEQQYGDGSTGVETVIQQILTAWASGVTLYTPNGTAGTPLNAGDLAGWNIKRYNQSREPVFDAIRKLAETLGYDIRYRWHANTSAFQLQIFAPDRSASTPDLTLDASEYTTIGNPTTDITGIRNVVTVVYGRVGEKLLTVTRTDATSISTYGRRWCEIQEDVSSQCDTSAEATSLADAVLTDLKDAYYDISIELPFLPHVELLDYIRIAADDVMFATAVDGACLFWQHDLNRQSARTTLRLRGKPALGIGRWLNGQRVFKKPSINTTRLAVIGADGRNRMPNGGLQSFSGG